MQRLAAGVNDKIDQMRDAACQKVKGALKVGEKVIAVGQYGKDLAAVMQVTVPKDWRFNNAPCSEKYIECQIPREKVAETIAWVKRNYPTAEIRMAD